MTDEDIAENEQLWKEENGEGKPISDAAGELRGAGISPTGIEADMGDAQGTEEAPADMEVPDMGAETPAAGTPPPV